MPSPQAAVTRWPPRETTSIRQTLDELSDLLDQQLREPGSPESVTNWLARLLVIRSCGYLEQVAAQVSQGFIIGRSGGQVRTFAQSWIPGGRNPWPENLLEWVGRFNANLGNDLRDLLDDDDQRLRREVAFLVDRRNKIAHGLNEGITPRKAQDLKEVACQVADWFILRFNPLR
jgi:RiboL-PSP-HEPN